MNFIDNGPVVELDALSKRTPSHGGFTWSMNTSTDANHVKYEIKNGFGEVIGDGMLLEETLRNAQRTLLSAIPVHYQTLDEFRSNALVMPVSGTVDGRIELQGERSLAAENPHFGLDAALSELRRELTDRYFRNPSIHTNEVRPKQWVENSIRRILSEPMSGSLRTMALPGGRHVILAHQSVMNTDVARMVHGAEVEEVLLRGEMVPAAVMEDYPELVEMAIALARQEDGESEFDVAELNADMESRLS